MDEVEAYLSLGSNLGDRGANLEEALSRLDRNPSIDVLAVSKVIETRAQGEWDDSGRGDFLNCCARISTSLSAEGLLDAVKSVETVMGRTGGERYDESGTRIYSDRPIDIDILLYGEFRLSTPRLTVPHPRMKERDFVMIPLLEIYSGPSDLLG